MNRFIAKSQSSKKALKVANMSASLPVNILIFGQIGTGKKLLAKEILPNAKVIEANELEKILSRDIRFIDEMEEIIVYNLHTVFNKKALLNKLKKLKVVATMLPEYGDFLDFFAVKIELLPLEKRKEDLEFLTEYYLNEAKKIYNTNLKKEEIKIDLSGNAITLKQSIYKAVMLSSITKNDLNILLENYFKHEMYKGKGYKELLELFEVPLLKAAKKLYKSQLQMAKRLKINRITLRKKLNHYFGE